jgi:cobyrinic acid a,c-diamide synthase
MGATLAFFSPLADATLPPCDALWLPGGYPELHLDRLAGNHAMRDAIRAHHAAGKAVLAECGGMLYCLEALDDGKGAHAPMLGLMPGRATMQASLAALGLQDMALRAAACAATRSTIPGWIPRYPPLPGPNPGGRTGEALFRQGSLHATYMHFYFPPRPPLSPACSGHGPAGSCA